MVAGRNEGANQRRQSMVCMETDSDGCLTRVERGREHFWRCYMDCAYVCGVTPGFESDVA